MTTTPAGWYDDGSGQQRWWDGTAWTAHTTPSAMPAEEVSDRTVVRQPFQSPVEPNTVTPAVTSQVPVATAVAPVLSGPTHAGPTHVPPRRRRRASAFIAAVFYTIIAIAGAYLSIHLGQPKLWIGTLLSGAYATYLWLGGRWVVFFF